MKKILVCGSRYLIDRKLVFEYLDKKLSQEGAFFLIEGGASGADEIARSWARFRCVPQCTVPANWAKLLDKAGSIRNGWMLLLDPDEVIAFPGGSGTHDMIERAKAARILVREIIPASTQQELVHEPKR